MPHVVRHLGGRYEVVRALGHGACYLGAVFLAHDHQADRDVALKMATFGDSALANRFLREIHRVETIVHPNIAAVHELFEDSGDAYIAMEYFELGSLRRRLRHGLELAAVATILEGVLAALAFAEQQGVAHGDLRPENVFFTGEGVVKVANFGVAAALRATDADRFMTATGSFGTPDYMAPEQALGEAANTQADLYSAGAIAFELVVGRPPFTGTPMSVLLQHVNDPPPAPSSIRPGIDPGVERLILTLLAKDPGARQSGKAALDDLVASSVVPSLEEEVRPPEEPGDTVSGTTEGDDAETVLQAMLKRAARAGIMPSYPEPRVLPSGGVQAASSEDVFVYHSEASQSGRPRTDVLYRFPREGDPPPAPDEVASAPRRVMVSAPSLVWSVVGAVAFVAAAAAAAKWLLGLFVEAEATSAEPADDVQCTVFAPPAARPGTGLIVQAFVHLPEAADDARAIATELDVDAQRRAFRSLEVPVRPGTRLVFELQLPGLVVDEPTTSLIWRRRTEAVQFGVNVPPETAAGTVVGTLFLSLDSVPVGHLKFKLMIGPDAPIVGSEPQGDDTPRYRFAFISYSSKNRDEVVRRVQLLSTVGIEYFQDILSLEAGDRWQKRLEAGIDKCDLFLLFWSSDAKESYYVRQEVLHALARKQGDDGLPPEIRPVILEGPPIVEPWVELAHLHFNDRLLYVLAAPKRDDGSPSPA